MKYQIISFSVVFLALALICNIPSSFGHGLGTETMPPVMIDGTEATLEVASTTSLDTGIRQIAISLFKTESGGMINDVSFEVELIKNEKILFKNNFERDDGILIMNLVPSEDSEVQIFNQETFASFFGLASDQFNLQGKVFEDGGLYKFNVKILTINSYDNVLSEPVKYDLGISIPETTYYEINDRNFGTQELGVITYFDQISEFSYDQETRQIEFSFPFQWDQKTIDQTSVIHEEVQIPKSFGDLLVSKFDVTLNEIDIPESAINIDDFTGEKRIIHVVVSQNELQEIFSSNQFNADNIVLKFQPNENSIPLSGVTENGQFKINLWWENEMRSNSDAKLSYDILDTFLMDRPISVPYELKLFYNEKELLKKTGISTGSKTQSDGFEFFVPSDVSGILVAKFENLGGNKLANVEFPLVVNRVDSEEEVKIPAWIKNNAGWWADGQIPDSTFVQGIQFLIKEGIIKIPETEQGDTSSSSIPDWVKNTAGWWANGEIPDSAFVNGIQYLIKVGIIVIEQETVEEQTMVESINLSIISPPKFDNHFEKYVEVFGIPIYATANTPDDKVLHAANVLAQYLDNDVDGTPDNPLVVEKIKANDGGIPLFSGEDIDDSILYTANDEYTEYCWIALYADETNPRNGFDASLEEILHMITECGYANAYPEIFGEHEDSLIAEYMDNARGGFFDQIPRSYPSDAWYTYDDYTCDYRCMITEYFYWSMTSILGAHENRLGEIGQEWKLNTKEKIMEGDPDIYNLLTEPEYKFPTILPDGNYQG